MTFEETLEQILRDGVDQTAVEWMDQVEEEYGRIPLIFSRMGERPEVLISHLLYKGSVTTKGTLDPKVVELVSLAVGSALKCPNCVDYHMRTAMRKGATREEILEVVLIAGMLANSAILANAYRIIDRVEQCPTCDMNGIVPNGTKGQKP